MIWDWKYKDVHFWCPTCHDTFVEPHPRHRIFRCVNCKTWLVDGDGQLFFPIFNNERP
jgi:hypothetical protein